jgi:RND superfamily putative drug exporter
MVFSKLYLIHSNYLLCMSFFARCLLFPLFCVVSLSSVWVFQGGNFEWASSNLKSIHSLYWLVPVMSFSILVGLGLDYDIFLVSRIYEYRLLGFTSDSAVVKGIYRTGSIITGAGVIMAIAFAGLMLSSVSVLNEFGFMLCFAVLFDTFIIRTLLVPALLGLMGDFNWW